MLISSLLRFRNDARTTCCPTEFGLIREGRSQGKGEAFCAQISPSPFNEMGQWFVLIFTGEPCRTNSKEFQPHDFIEIHSLNKVAISEKMAELYRSGLTLRQVARRLGVCKNTVRETLLAAKVALRPSCRDYDKPAAKTGKPFVGAPPFGYCCQRGRLVPDPKEAETLHLILALWKSGKSLSDIMRQLNRQRIKTRKGAPWKPATIRAIVLRHKNQPDYLEEVSWESTN